MKALKIGLTLPIMLASSIGWAQEAQEAPDACGSHIEAYLAELPEAAPDEATVATLRHMRLEEKLARDVYRAFDEAWGLPVFAHIARAEQHHLDHLAWLFERYGLEDAECDCGGCGHGRGHRHGHGRGAGQGQGAGHGYRGGRAR